MHRLPRSAGFDVEMLEVLAYFLGSRTERLSVERHDGKPAIRIAVREVGHELDPRNIGQCAAVAPVDLFPSLHHGWQPAKLSPSYRREQIAQPVIEAHFRVLVVRCRISRLRGEVARPLDEPAVLARPTSLHHLLSGSCCR